MSSDVLMQMAWDAEDNGDEVEVYRHNQVDEVIEYIEINGIEYLNEHMVDELEGRDFDAERLWRE